MSTSHSCLLFWVKSPFSFFSLLFLTHSHIFCLSFKFSFFTFQSFSSHLSHFSLFCLGALLFPSNLFSSFSNCQTAIISLLSYTHALFSFSPSPRGHYTSIAMVTWTIFLQTEIILIKDSFLTVYMP